jgi:hypothetical protein
VTETVTTASALIERTGEGGGEQNAAHRPLVWHHGIEVMAGGVLVIAGTLLPGSRSTPAFSRTQG